MVAFALVLALLSGLAPVTLAPSMADAATVRPSSAPIPYSATGPDTLSIDRLYAAYFLREPDPAGVSYWKSRHAGGMPLAHVSLHFATSAEFTSRYGALSDADFIRLVYRNVLEREADPGGLDHWYNMMVAGRTRGWVMLGFSDSAEFKIRTGLIGEAPAPTLPSAPNPAMQLGVHYAFNWHHPGDPNNPVKMDPCRPVQVASDLANSYPYADRAIHRALDQMSRATGMEWRYLGSSAEARQAANVQVTFVSLPNPGRAEMWAEWRRNVGYQITRGKVEIAQNYRGMTEEFLTVVLMHEFGHVAGLDHPSDPNQIMSAVARYGMRAEWEPGDIAGLRLVGRTGPCLLSGDPQPEPISLMTGSGAPPGATHIVFSCGCASCARRDTDDSDLALAS